MTKQMQIMWHIYSQPVTKQNFFKKKHYCLFTAKYHNANCQLMYRKKQLSLPLLPVIKPAQLHKYRLHGRCCLSRLKALAPVLSVER